jgi:hypothetical protein
MARRPVDDIPETPDSEPERGLFGWMANFDDPVAVKAASGGPRAPRGKALPLAILGGALLLAGATLAAALTQPFQSSSTAPSAGPRVHGEPEPSPSASEEVAKVPTIIPDDCLDLYGQAMEAEFERETMHLNRVWTGAREAPAGSTDPQLLTMLPTQLSLDCFWLDETGGTKAAVLTVASEPGPEVTAAVEARLVELGFGRQTDRGGVRYFAEHRIGTESRGESHFVRDGVWLATNWYGFGPWGYTGHMAENVFR